MVGDSMIGSLKGNVSVMEAGSEIECLSETNTIKIREVVKQKSESSNGGLLVLHGGGDGLNHMLKTWQWPWCAFWGNQEKMEFMSE